MSNPSEHSNSIWLSFDQLVKYVKGNLLGLKKQEVEDKVSASPLLSDAVDGLKDLEHPEKLEAIIDSINRKIQLKSGAAGIAAMHQAPPTDRPSSGKPAFSSKSILSIAASLIILISAVTLIFWKLNSQSQPNSNESLVLTEPEQPINQEKLPLNDRESLDLKQNTTPPLALHENDSTSFDDLTAFDFKSEERRDMEAPSIERVENEVVEKADKTIATKPTATKSVELAKTSNSETPALTFNSTSSSPITNNTEFNYEITTDSTPTEAKDQLSYDSYRSKASVDQDKQVYESGLSLYNQGKLAEAAQEFLKLEDAKNSDYQDDAIWNLAQIYLKQGDEKAAKKALKKIRNSAKYGARAKEELDKL